jgi:hypothetical protein
MFLVYLPPMRGKLAGWLRSTVFTTYQDRATRYATEADAKAAIERAAKFHLKSQIKATRIVAAPVDAARAEADAICERQNAEGGPAELRKLFRMGG